jgi:hypothetical protein
MDTVYLVAFMVVLVFALAWDSRHHDDIWRDD